MLKRGIIYHWKHVAVNYDDEESRDTRSRRRMTDDDDTVLDNASVNSQDGE